MSRENLIMRIIMQANDKASAAFRRIQAAGGGLSNEMIRTKNELKELNRTMGKADTFANYKNQLQSATQAVRENERAIERLSNEIRQSGRPTRAQITQMAQLENKARSLAQKETELKDRVSALGRELHAAGFDTNNFGQAQAQSRRRAAELAAQLERQRQSLERLNNAEKRYQRTKEMQGRLNSVGAKAATAGLVVNTGVGLTVKAAVSEQDAMLGIVKQVDSLKNADNSLNHAEIAKIRKEIQGLSQELPLSTVEIMSLYEAGARMDIPRKELESYVKVAAQAAAAFDAPDVGEMAESLGKINKNFKLTAEQGKELADVINYLDDNSISKGAGIIDYMNRVSGIAGLAKISDKNMAALGSTLMTMGSQAEEAGTAVNAIFTRLSSAPNIKPVWETLEMIGLKAEDVQKGMAKDAQGTIMKIIAAIKAMPEEKRTGIVGKLVGTEHVKTMSKLVSNTEEWVRQIELANSQDAIGSMEREFQVRMDGMSARWQVFKNSLFNVSSGVGSMLFDSISSVLEKGGHVLNMMNRWAQANPQLAGAIMKVVAVIGIALMVISALAFTIAAVLGPIALAQLSWTRLAVSMATGASKIGVILNLLKTGIMAVGRVFLMNPIGLAITAIVVALYFLWKHWDKVKAYLTKGWDVIGKAASGVWDGIKQKTSAAWEGIKSAAMGAFQWFDNLFAENPILNFIFPILGIPRMIIANWQPISAFFTTLWSGIVSVASGLWQQFVGHIISIKDTLLPIWNAMVSGALMVWQMFTGAMSAIWQNIKAIAVAAWSALVSYIANYSPLAPIIQNWNRIIAFLMGLKERMMGIGRNIIDGLVNGIQSGFNGLKSVWTGINNFLPSFTSKRMDVRSPSRVMAKLGNYIIQGLGVGIQRGKAALANTYDKAIGVFQNPITTGGFLDRAVKTFMPEGNPMHPKLAGAIDAPSAGFGMAGKQQSMSMAGDNITIQVFAGNNDVGSIRKEIEQVLRERDMKKQRTRNSSFWDKD